MTTDSVWARARGVESRLACAAAVSLAVLWASPARADIVVLNDGTRVEGEIVRELSGAVWLRVASGTLTTERFFAPGEIAEIIRIDPADASPGGFAADDDGPAPRVFSDGAPRGVVVTLEGTIGISITADHLEDLIPVLEREVGDDGSGIVVLKINSGGGFLLEIEKLSDVLHNEYKRRFRTVAWVESAISAAAMTSHCLEEIYFFSEGNYGACTGWFADLQAVEGRSWEETNFLMERISARGGYDPVIMRAMMGHPEEGMPLSASRDPRTGAVLWAQNDEIDGYTVLNPSGEVLTLNSVQAETWEFSKGTVNSLDELTSALGFEEVNWIGRDEVGVRFPVSRAEEINRRWRASIAEDEQRLEETLVTYQLYLTSAAGAQGDARAALAGKARRELRSIRRIFDLSNNVALLIGILPTRFDEWYEQQEEQLRDLVREDRQRN